MILYGYSVGVFKAMSTWRSRSDDNLFRGVLVRQFEAHSELGYDLSSEGTSTKVISNLSKGPSEMSPCMQECSGKENLSPK